MAFQNLSCQNNESTIAFGNPLRIRDGATTPQARRHKILSMIDSVLDILDEDDEDEQGLLIDSILGGLHVENNDKSLDSYLGVELVDDGSSSGNESGEEGATKPTKKEKG
jgi:hypothetical protein